MPPCNPEPGPAGAPIVVGVSSCLLGEQVRYDGGHKHDRYLTDCLGRFFRFVPVCPEVECGLSIPRESMRLEGDPAAPRLVTNKTRIDLTDRMLAWCESRVMELADEELCGFVFKKDSPSSGLFRVKVYNNGVAAKNGRGLFAAAVTARFPLLPVEEEGRLNDPDLRENFIERVFTYRRWKDFLRGAADIGGLVEFHTRHKLLIMAHNPRIYREMGALVARAGERERTEVFQAYGERLMQALAFLATAKKNTDVLLHIMGYFKRDLSGAEKAELLETIGLYHDRLVPLVVPLTLLKHYVNKYGQEYLARQVYLAPHPAELMLRNHV